MEGVNEIDMSREMSRIESNGQLLNEFTSDKAF